MPEWKTGPLLFYQTIASTNTPRQVFQVATFETTHVSLIATLAVEDERNPNMTTTFVPQVAVVDFNHSR